ncbi:MAG: hypothetical protein LAO05_13385 [Acidobacteriia bacterium]|nr:hypothetical protein [Terriglobia bacterium]
MLRPRARHAAFGHLAMTGDARAIAGGAPYTGMTTVFAGWERVSPWYARREKAVTGGGVG